MALVTVDGRTQTFDPAYDPRDGSWFSIFGDDVRSQGDWGHWTGRGMNYDAQCGSCHDTDFRDGFDGNVHRPTMVEIGVGCEACHGPSARHAAGTGPPPVARPGRETCAPCHSRRSALVDSPQPGAPLLDSVAPAAPDLSDAFWPDGRVREEVFEENAFAGSRMAQMGVTCTDCHKPHDTALRAEGDALCATCHAATPRHDHHPDGTTSCVSCHMPTTTYMGRHERHDHAFVAPDPALTVSHGVPSACDACHKEPSKLARAAAEWWGPADRPSMVRARALANARRGEGRDAVLDVLANDPHPVWRARAHAWLDPWLGQPEVERALLAGASDPDAATRAAATAALGRGPVSPTVAAALERNVRDPVRLVRVEAQRAVRASRPVRSPDLADYVSYLDVQAEQPAAMAELAAWHTERGDPAAAVQILETAKVQDPRSPVIRHQLAVGLAATRRATEAEAELRAARALAPDDATIAAAHALALSEIGRLAEADAALAASVALDPTDVRNWQNLALMRMRDRGLNAALQTLGDAEAALVDDPMPPWLAASLLRDAGREAEARVRVTLALKRDPRHPGARALAQSLGVAPP